MTGVQTCALPIYPDLLAVVAGTTLGMMLANAPVVWLGDKITKLVPLPVVHRVSAAIFALLGVIALWPHA